VSAQDGIRFLPSIAGEVLQSLGRHRLLTARQVQVLHLPGISLRYTQRVLAELHKAGLIDRGHAAHGTALWFPTPEGQLLLRSKGRLDSQLHRSTLEQVAGASSAHTHALNETGIAFIKAARARGDECDAFSWRHEVAHPLTPPHRSRDRQWLIADALLSYLEVQSRDSVLHQRFIELHLATSPVEQLAAKLGKYKLLHHCSGPADQRGAPAELGWRSRYRTFPQLLVVLAGQEPSAAQRRIGHILLLWRTDPATRDLEPIPLHFVTLEQLTRDGPYAPIFTNADEPERPQKNWLGEPVTDDTVWKEPA
jgi:hypothetical protein